MATKIDPYLINITVSSIAGAANLMKIKAINRTTSEQLTLSLDISGLADLECTSFDTGYTDGDIIDIYLGGAETVTGSHTIDVLNNFGGADVSLTAVVASSSLPGVTI